jgi:lipooligosaccharide transport system permease protein
VIQVWRRNFLFFRKTFLVSFFWTILEPTMYLVAIGFGLGRFVEQIENLTFIEFYYPGLLASTAMMVSYFESTYPNYTKLTYQKTFSTMLLTPLSPNQILFGEILWGATKGFIGVCGVIFVSMFFNLFKMQILFALPVLFLLCLVFSAFGLIMTSTAKNYDSFIFSTSGIIIPMSLISGTYFSIQNAPMLVKGIAQLLPLTHAVALTRIILYRRIEPLDWISFVVLVIYLGLFLYFARKVFERKLIS